MALPPTFVHRMSEVTSRGTPVTDRMHMGRKQERALGRHDAGSELMVEGTSLNWKATTAVCCVLCCLLFAHCTRAMRTPCQSNGDCTANQKCVAAGCVQAECTSAEDCGTHQRCDRGQCEATIQCPEGQTLCGQECVNTQTNPTHCGACARSCGEGIRCLNGTCGCQEGKPCDGSDRKICINQTCRETWVVQSKSESGPNHQCIPRHITYTSDGVFVTGGFGGRVTFPTHPAQKFLAKGRYLGPHDVYVGRIDLQGKWLWVRQAGGSDIDEGHGIGVHQAKGRVFLSGGFKSPTFQCFDQTAIQVAAEASPNKGDYDFFLAELDILGNWKKVVSNGGRYSDHATALTVDEQGTAYSVGWWSTLVNGQNPNGFDLLTLSYTTEVAYKVHPEGKQGHDKAEDIAVGSNGNLYFVGQATGSLMGLQGGETPFAFVAQMHRNKLSTLGKVWGPTTPPGSTSYARRVAVDGQGNVYIAGIFLDGPIHFTINGTQTTLTPQREDVFVAKMDPKGNWLWARRAGSPAEETLGGLGVDGRGNVYIAGGFSGTASFGTHSISSNGALDLFVAKLTTNGEWLWARGAGGPENDAIQTLAVDKDGNYYPAGLFNRTFSMGAASVATLGDYECLVSKNLP
ncbi:MAG: hypothetical protein EP343_14890 [Deltaproteobacteria bacterium]|nr:MAG: hypothetical protein EP343_14890 [Deltaproteobacteria bacterium]